MDTGLRRLHYFRALASQLNFRRTADTLGLTQPALSRAIALLESDIGVALFTRSRAGVALTPAGQAFAAGTANVLTELEGAITQARRIAAGEAGELVIGYTDTAITGCLPDIVHRFRERYPALEVALRQGYTHQQRQWLQSGILDVAFMTGPDQHPDRSAVDVQSDRFTVVLPRTHRLATATALRLADLADEPFVLGDADHWSVYNEHLFRLCSVDGFVPRVVQSAPDSRGIIGLVSCGMGLSVQTESLTRHGDSRVVFRPLSDCDDMVVTQAVWLTQAEHAPTRRFLNYLIGNDSLPTGDSAQEGLSASIAARSPRQDLTP